MFDTDFIIENNTKTFLNKNLNSHQRLYYTFLLSNKLSTKLKVIKINDKEPEVNYIPIMNSNESFNFYIQESDDSEYAYKLTTDIYNGDKYTIAIYIKSDNIGSTNALAIFDGQYISYMKEPNKEFTLNTSYSILKDSSLINYAELKYFDYNDNKIDKIKLQCAQEIPLIDEQIKETQGWLSDFNLPNIEYMLKVKDLDDNEKFNIHLFINSDNQLCGKVDLKMDDIDVNKTFLLRENSSIKQELLNCLEDIRLEYNSNKIIEYVQEIQNTL